MCHLLDKVLCQQLNCVKMEMAESVMIQGRRVLEQRLTSQWSRVHCVFPSLVREGVCSCCAEGPRELCWGGAPGLCGEGPLLTPVPPGGHTWGTSLMLRNFE